MQLSSTHFRKRTRERTRTPPDLIANAWCLKQPLMEKEDCDLPLCTSTQQSTTTTSAEKTTSTVTSTTTSTTVETTTRSTSSPTTQSFTVRVGFSAFRDVIFSSCDID